MYLIGEAVGHDEWGVAGGAAQIAETALRQQNDVPAVLHRVTIHLKVQLSFTF